MTDSPEKKPSIDPKNVIAEIEADTTTRLERAGVAKETKQAEAKEAEKTPIRKIIAKIGGDEKLEEIERKIEKKKTNAPN